MRLNVSLDMMFARLLFQDGAGNCKKAYKVQLRSRETLINNVDFNNNTIGYDNCKFIMY